MTTDHSVTSLHQCENQRLRRQ